MPRSLRPSRTPSGPTSTPKPTAQTLRFAATLDKVSAAPAKVTAGAPTGLGRPADPPRVSGGELIVSFRIARPQLPKPPERPYELQYAKPEFTDVAPVLEAKGDDETAKAFGDRKREHERALARWTQQRYTMGSRIERYEAAEAKYAKEVDRYNEAAIRMGAEFEQFARLAGIGSLMAGLPVSVAITLSAATSGTYLPGLAAQAPLALAAPTPAGTE